MQRDSQTGEPNLKRPRLPLQDIFERDLDFYIEDGNIILSTKDKDGNITYFRVHRSTLMKHSPIFRDMFNIPTPPDMDLYDGVPVVQLQDDPNDLKAFLTFLYEPFTAHFHSFDKNFASSMLGPLKIATKYEVDALRLQIISHFEAEWPDTLPAWDKLEDQIESRFKDDLITLDKLEPEPASVILLARCCDVPRLLPSAFYHLSRLSAATRFEEDCCEDGSEALLPSFFGMRQRRRRSAFWSLLTRQDLDTLALGKERMGRWISGQARILLCSSFTTQKAECRKGVALIWAQLQSDILTHMDILTSLRKLALTLLDLDQEVVGSLCHTCRFKLASSSMDRREQFFSLLPHFFGLDDDAVS